MSEVKVYTMPDCGHCKQVKKFLTKNEIPFTAYDLTTDVEGQQFMDAHGYRVVPVVTIDDKTLIGGKMPELRSALTEAGLLSQQ